MKVQIHNPHNNSYMGIPVTGLNIGSNVPYFYNIENLNRDLIYYINTKDNLDRNKYLNIIKDIINNGFYSIIPNPDDYLNRLYITSDYNSYSNYSYIIDKKVNKVRNLMIENILKYKEDNIIKDNYVQSLILTLDDPFNFNNQIAILYNTNYTIPLTGCDEYYFEKNIQSYKGMLLEAEFEVYAIYENMKIAHILLLNEIKKIFGSNIDDGTNYFLEKKLNELTN